MSRKAIKQISAYFSPDESHRLGQASGDSTRSRRLARGLCGTMQWEEITRIAKTVITSVSPTGGLVLHVAGGRVLIPDIYAVHTGKLESMTSEYRGV